MDKPSSHLSGQKLEKKNCIDKNIKCAVTLPGILIWTQSKYFYASKEGKTILKNMSRTFIGSKYFIPFKKYSSQI